MSDANRANARQLCNDAIARGEPLAWFEELYAAARDEPATIPWADLEPNPNLVAWQAAKEYDFQGQRCLTIGCGLGDDCEYLQSAGGNVRGFDISPTAIDWCRRRFPGSGVDYSVCDLFDTPRDWNRGFDFVLEAYTLQVLPPEFRQRAIEAISEFVADEGTLLVICRARDESSPAGQMPWPLTRSELSRFGEFGLMLENLEEYQDDEEPPVYRFRAEFRARHSRSELTSTTELQSNTIRYRSESAGRER